MTSISFFLTTTCPPRSTLFPYTTLFRSRQFDRRLVGHVGVTAATAVQIGEHGVQVVLHERIATLGVGQAAHIERHQDRKSTRLNSSHQIISYAVFCLKKKIHDPSNLEPQ